MEWLVPKPDFCDEMRNVMMSVMEVVQRFQREQGRNWMETSRSRIFERKERLYMVYIHVCVFIFVLLGKNISR